jgi:hypothetical protein
MELEPGAVAERLGRGLQSPVQRFESAPRLSSAPLDLRPAPIVRPGGEERFLATKNPADSARKEIGWRARLRMPRAKERRNRQRPCRLSSPATPFAPSD